MSTVKTRIEGAISASAGNRVGISLMVSSDTEAIIEVTRRNYPDAKIDFRDCFYKVERGGSLSWRMDDIGECLGRPYDTDLFLVNMSSYYGRILVTDGRVQLSSAMILDRSRDRLTSL